MEKVDKPLASLGDFFPVQELECAISGCDNLCLGESKETDESPVTGDDRLPEPTCEHCRRLYAELADQNRPCLRPGCQGVWTWSRIDQLSARRLAETRALETVEPPQGLCLSCRQEAEVLGDLEVECVINGCRNTWRWPAAARLIDPDGVPKEMMCRQCEQTMAVLQDRSVRCCVDGCSNSWCWSSLEQLEEMIRTGLRRSPPTGPRRRCRECEEKLEQLQERRIPCRVAGCKRTWPMTAEAQLRYQRIHGAEADPATDVKRMCDECYQFIKSAKPHQVPCRIRGCHNHWVYTPSRQLHDFARGRHRPPPLLCIECRDRLQQIKPLDNPCATPGCGGTWAWSPEDQLRHEIKKTERHKFEKIPEKRCSDCDDFLHSHTVQTLFCNDCGREISWSPYEQLMHHRGIFAKPGRCSVCAARSANEKNPQPEDFIKPSEHQVFQLPARGPWLREPVIAHLPPGLDQAALVRLRQADARIVAFGDETTVSGPSGWPLLLEKILNQRLRDEAITVAVANAGIKGCDSRLARLRLERDVLPFKPHVVIMSFVFADAFVDYNAATSSGYSEKTDDKEIALAEEQLLRQLLAASTNLIYWLPNPIFPHDQLSDADGENRRRWADAWESRYRHARARATHLYHSKNVPIVDLGSRFEVNGKRSAVKWMDGPFFPNAAGNRNIANWLAESILHHNLVSG